MKCPKCQYLGFETGLRCRNCGYDFSLLPPAGGDADDDVIRPEADLLRADPADLPVLQSAPVSLDDLPLSFEPAGAAAAKPSRPRLRRPQESSPAAAAGERQDGTLADTRAEELPLFSSSGDLGAPLVRVPQSPRTPVAVRKTPAVPRVVRPPAPLRRDERPPLTGGTRERGGQRRREQDAAESRPPSERAVSAAPCTASQRAIAAAIDGAVVGGLHLLVLYFTIRMAGLTAADWRLLPRVPLVGFLGALTVAYFVVLTACGGQTIGKMAMDIRVVSDDGLMTTARALARALAAIGSVAMLGAGLLPAFFGEGRALHDRIARTRVVAVRSAV
jgi:uncharacterized RDD family membrane protein YckC